MSDNDVMSSLTLPIRRDSKETSLEEDEGLILKALINACDVTKP